MAYRYFERRWIHAFTWLLGIIVFVSFANHREDIVGLAREGFLCPTTIIAEAARNQLSHVERVGLSNVLFDRSTTAKRMI